MGVASSTLSAEPAGSQSAHKWLIALAVMLGTALQVLDTSIVNVSLPHMQGSFSASVDEIAWVVTSYLVANGIMLAMTGFIAGRFGRKRYFLFSVFAFVLTSALCGIAGSLDQIVLFRILQGAAGAAMQPLSQAILMETFPPDEQQMAMAAWGLGLMAAPILGPTLGGWITDKWSWRWNFYINVPIGALAFLMVYVFVHDPPYLRRHRKTASHIDWLGIGLLTVGLGLFQIVMDRGQRSDWFQTAWVCEASVVALVALVWLPFQELRCKEPVFDVRVLKEPVFALAIFLLVCTSFVLYGTSLLNPVFFQEFMGYSAWDAGLVLAPRGIGSAIALLTVGALARRRVDTRPLLGLSFILMAWGLWEISKWNLQVGMWGIIWPTLIVGCGLGVGFPILTAIGLSCFRAERMSHATSVFNVIRAMGAAIGVSYMSTMFIRYQQIHQSRLVDDFSVFNAWKLSQAPLRMPGSPAFHYLPQLLTGQKQGLERVYGLIQSQSAMLSLNDIYRILALAMILLVPAFLWLPRQGTAAGAAMD
ncbi:MAG: DHA2 family efflux MFS transporter permease subunit [Candidatus Binataceae bacterium]